jgi:hypothetical protein
MFGLRYFSWAALFNHSSRNKKRRVRPAPALEALEDRWVPADFKVDGLGDAGQGVLNQGDLRYCIDQSNLLAGPNTITFKQGLTGNIVIRSTLTITKPVTISGPGATKLTVARDFAPNTPLFK